MRSAIRSNICNTFLLSTGFDKHVFQFLLMVILSLSVTSVAYAQNPDSGQMTLSKDLSNDPIAQDLLRKIEQTKKMITELERKEFEQNQARENLEQMRNDSIARLAQDLDEWERLWEKHSSRNSFEQFVNHKPSFVQGVFWDQFEFMEQKVLAGRAAMGNVLANGGTMQEAKLAYHSAASTQKIELIEMNAQFNVKHNLADYEEQQIFNSTGQVHFSPATQAKLAEIYSDYKTQPGYIIANTDDLNVENTESGAVQCETGYVLVTRVTSGVKTCVSNSIAQKWIDNNVSGVIVGSNNNAASYLKITPGTQCEENHFVIYNTMQSEYQCVSDAIANKMLSEKTGEIHTLPEYILKKDAQKIIDDTIFTINQSISQLQHDYDANLKSIEIQYNKMIDSEKSSLKNELQEVVEKYKNDGKINKELITEILLEIRNTSDSLTEKLYDEKLESIQLLNIEFKKSLKDIVNGYENNPKINIDWNIFDDDIHMPQINKDISTQTMSMPIQNGIFTLDNIGIVDAFGKQFDEIKIGQALQIAADITNPYDHDQQFVYAIAIADEENNTIQDSRWVSGTLNPDQTFNVSLSWTPDYSGLYYAIVSTGANLNSTVHVANVSIEVQPSDRISNENYCKNNYVLLFKYSDNSPMCASPDTASKLIDIGMAFY